MKPQQSPTTCIHGKMCTALHLYLKGVLPANKCAIQKCVAATSDFFCPHYSEDRGWEQGFQDGQTSALTDLNLFEDATRKNERAQVVSTIRGMCVMKSMYIPKTLETIDYYCVSKALLDEPEK